MLAVFLQYYTFTSLTRIATNSEQLYWGRRYDNNEERAYKVEDENQQNDKKMWVYL